MGTKFEILGLEDKKNIHFLFRDYRENVLSQNCNIVIYRDTIVHQLQLSITNL